MTQLGIIACNGIGLTFVRHGEMETRFIGEFAIGRHLMTVIPPGGRHFIEGFLQQLVTDEARDLPADNTARRSIHKGYDVGFVFLCSMKVCNSSISMVSTWSGCGAGGNCAACACSQLASNPSQIHAIDIQFHGLQPQFIAVAC